ncbi:hypothetical protein [Geobacter anodireducens]
MKTKRILQALVPSLLIPLLVPLGALAAPSISSVSNPVFIHGQSITVSGSGFGVKSPVEPAFLDVVSYNGLRNGDKVPVGGINPWPAYCGGTSVYYKTSNPRGKWISHYSNQWSTEGAKQGALDGAIINGASTSGKLYVTWWNYVSSDPTVGGTNASNKWVRLLSGSWGQAGQGTIIWEPTMFYAYAFTAGYLPGMNWDNWRGAYPRWNRMEMFVDSTKTNSPQYSAWTNNVLVGNHTSSPSQSWRVNQLGCLGFDGSNSPAANQPTVDWGEIYADNTLARVEICNAATKSSSSHCEIQLPQLVWIDGQLQIKVNQGSLPDNSTAYLYVIDASGNTSSGKQITFGSGDGGGTATIAPPSGLKVVN